MKFLVPSMIGLHLATALLWVGQPARAQSFPKAPPNCVYLREVTTGRPFIRKTIASNNSNANTDFVVPTGTSFSSYNGKFIPENNANYTVEANLKYADNTTSRVINRPIKARRFYLYQQPFRTPTATQPFQINARITGDRNTAYQISVLACR